jgi:predicted RNase H-like HicB family nuclease
MTTKIGKQSNKKVETRKLLFRVPIIVEFDKVNYHSYSPALQGLHMDGETEKVALENARETAKDFLQIMIECRMPIPLSILTLEEAKKLPDSMHKEGYYIEEIIIDLK